MAMKSARAAKARSIRPARRRGTGLFHSSPALEKRARATAKALGVPLWVLMIPGLNVAGQDMERHAKAIHKMVEEYLAEHCIAPALASLHRELGIGAH